MKDIKRLLKNKVLILDGATGTELQKRGMPHGVCPEHWSVENPEVIRSIHADYIKAGSDVIYTCTFGANREKLAQYNLSDAYGINKRLARLARGVAGKDILVAGDIGPTGKFVEPFGSLEFEEAVDIFKEQARGLLDGGVDLFVIETMMDIQEARAALIAVKELTDKFTIVTMTYEKNSRTLNGTPPLAALVTLQSLGADAVGCNCSLGPEPMLSIIEQMKPYAAVPLVAKPNAGLPQFVDGKTKFDMDKEKFASFGKAFVSKGANIIGGCCGTTPAYIKELKKNIGKSRPLKPVRKSVSALSSARKAVFIEKARPLVLIGECINPTGKKALQAELREGKMSLVRKLAKDQEAKGADILDVNIGVSGIDELKTFKDILAVLSLGTELPLVIDSSNEKAIEAAVRVYPGRALINSISGESKKIKRLLPLAAKYGAMFILLPIDKSGIAESFEKRKKIIGAIFNQAQKLGFTKEDIIVDCLAMTVSSNPKSATETIKTIKWCSGTLNANTIIGLSNISFGLPMRPWINAAFLAMAHAGGLGMVLADPLNEELMNVKKASDVLLEKDRDAVLLISYAGKSKVADFKEISDKAPIEERIAAAILEGAREEVKPLAEAALKAGISANKLVNEAMIPAINKVGELFDKKEYFLPQLIASAETMKICFEDLKPHFDKEVLKDAKKTVIILATVKGDIHDIGKNIVALMLENHGFSVIDLGKDVSSSRIINEVKRHKSPIVGLSALMTTTMVNMPEVITLAKKEGLDCRFILGGAVVTKPYAQSLGAEYAGDSVEAVRVVKKMGTAEANPK